MSCIAALQMTSSNIQSQNLEVTEALIKQASEAGAELLVLPETFSFMGMQMSEQRQQAELPGQGVVQDWLARVSQQYGVWIIAGTLPVCDSAQADKAYAASLVYNPAGEVVGRYDKIHLFDVDVPASGESFRESAVFEYGDKLLCQDTPVGRCGVTVCYDIRFPELFAQLTADGAQVLIVSAAFTYATGQAHWLTLLKARAIENQCYLVAAAQTGVHCNGRQTYGHSVIINPWGEVIDLCEQGEGMAIGHIDLEQLADIRQAFPTLNHHRL